MRSVVLVCLMMMSLAWLCLVQANPIESSSPSSVPVPAPAPAEALPEEVAEGSKMSKFLDDFTSAFKQGTAKMKESLESAASSVKDGVLQGYDYVRSKLTGDRAGAVTEEPPPAPVVEPDQEQEQNGAEDVDATPITSTQAAGLTSSLKPSASTSTPAAAAAAARPSISAGEQVEQEQVSFGAAGGGLAGSGAIGIAHEPAQIVPNDENGTDDDRIFFNDKDLEGAAAEAGERDGETEQPVTNTTPTVDNRFILAGPLACKTGQEAVNGKCRNVF